MTVTLRGMRGTRYTLTARAYSNVPDPNGFNNYATRLVQA